MRRTWLRAGVVAGVLALGVSGIALAQDQKPDTAGKPESTGKPDTAGKPETKAGKKKAYGHGENWPGFAKAFDANADGKVSKEEFLAKRPAFDRVDGNKDGSVTAEEVKAMPAVQKRGGTGANFVAKFDADHDGKVTTAEYDTKRTALFDRLDKNKDGVIEQSEFKGKPADEDIE